MRSVPSLLAVLAPLTLLPVASGCHDRLYDFTGTLTSPSDAGPTDHFTVEHPSGGSGGLGGSGGGGSGGGGSGGSGGAAGAGGAGGAAGAGGGPQLCDDHSPDRLTDIANCGHCFNLCNAPNTDPQCINGACQYTCVGGFFDADGNPANGCECQKTNGGVEACDGIDNDCNGIVDEGFDFNSITNCGGCNRACSFPFATATCNSGVCTQGACRTDFYDRDPLIPGCETQCQKTNGGVEICDGLDNDCDGVVDDNLSAPTITCRSQGSICSGITPTCMGATGWACNYRTGYEDVEGTANGCDGLDNDCDGKVDEAYQIGQACTVGSGACANPAGVWVCNATKNGHTCSGSPKPPGTEVCDGIDNDCDGKIDELDSSTDKSNDTLVTFTTGGATVTMFAYEASRYDSSGSSHGFDNTRRPCSVPGKQPWANIKKEDAAAACALIGPAGSGWRLCTANEWLDACNSSGNTTFPYGANYDGTKCNGYDYAKPAGTTTLVTGGATTGSGSSCVSTLTATDKLYDMSGNVKEWVTSTTATTGYEMRGGAYNIQSFIDSSVSPSVMRAPGLQCDASSPAPTDPVILPSVGFRCCRTGALP